MEVVAGETTGTKGSVLGVAFCVMLIDSLTKFSAGPRQDIVL